MENLWHHLMKTMMSKRESRGCSGKFFAEELVGILPQLSHETRKARFMRFIYEATGGPPDLLKEENLINFQNSKRDISKSIQTAAKARISKSYPVLKKKFFERFGDFLVAFVIQSGIQFFAVDEGFEDIESFLEMLMLNGEMHYRHTATLVYLKIITAGMQIGSEILSGIEQDEDLSNLNSQFSHRDDLAHLKAVLKNMSKKVCCRFGDKRSHQIRLMCLREAEKWCKGKLFFGIKALNPQYIGVALMGKDRTLRMQALRVVVSLFGNLNDQDDSIVASARRLLGVLYKALEENTKAKDEECAALAVSAFTEALKKCRSVVPQETRKFLLELVYCSRLRVSIQAGVVLKVLLEQETEDDSERIRGLLTFSAGKVGSESFIFWGLQRAACEWFLDPWSWINLFTDPNEPLSQNERVSAISFFGFLVQYLTGTTEEMPLRQCIPKEKVLQNLLPAPPKNKVLKPLETEVSLACVFILQECCESDQERAYFVRLLNFISFKDASNAQHVPTLIAWLRQAFKQTEHAVILEEISRALATLGCEPSAATELFRLDDLCKDVVDKVMYFLSRSGGNYQDAVERDASLAVVLSGLKEAAALIAHGHWWNLKTWENLGWLTDLANVLKAFANVEYLYVLTPLKIEVIESILRVYLVCLSRMYDTIPLEAWTSIPLSPDCKAIRENAKTCLILGNILILKEHFHLNSTALAQKIYPVMCAFLVDMVRIGHQEKTLKMFLDASNVVLARDVFRFDEDGGLSDERVELGLKILCPFARVIQSGAINVAKSPPVCNHYKKFCRSYDEVMDAMIVSKKDVSDEWNLMAAILRCVQIAFCEEDEKFAKEIADELARLYGKVEVHDTPLVFHEMILMVCIKLSPSGWTDRSRNFVAIVQESFDELMIGSKQQLSEYLDSKIPEFLSVSRDTPIKLLINEYLQSLSFPHEVDLSGWDRIRD